MSATLETRYRRLLLAYPRAYREQRGDELLDTLLQLSPPERSRPSARQAGSLLLCGLRMRTGADRLDGVVGSWLDAARVALMLVLAMDVVLQPWMVVLVMGDYNDGFPTGALAVAVIRGVLAATALVTVARGHYRVAFGLVLLIPVPAIAIYQPVNFFDLPLPVPAILWWLPMVGLMVPLLLIRPAPVPWRWLVSVPLLVVASMAVALAGPLWIPLIVTLAAVVACVVWGAVVDPRPALGLGLLLLLSVPQLVGETPALLITAPVFIPAALLLLAAGSIRVARLPATGMRRSA